MFLALESAWQESDQIWKWRGDDDTKRLVTSSVDQLLPNEAVATPWEYPGRAKVLQLPDLYVSACAHLEDATGQTGKLKHICNSNRFLDAFEKKHTCDVLYMCLSYHHCQYRKHINQCRGQSRLLRVSMIVECYNFTSQWVLLHFIHCNKIEGCPYEWCFSALPRGISPHLRGLSYQYRKNTWQVEKWKSMTEMACKCYFQQEEDEIFLQVMPQALTSQQQWEMIRPEGRNSSRFDCGQVLCRRCIKEAPVLMHGTQFGIKGIPVKWKGSISWGSWISPNGNQTKDAKTWVQGWPLTAKLVPIPTLIDSAILKV